MTIENSTRNRPSVWEDEAPAEPRIRRVRQGAPLPGMPEMSDPEGDDSSRPGGGRFGEQRVGRSHQDRSRSRWWRPASTAGRVFLALMSLSVLGGLGASAYLLKTFLSRDSRFRIAGSSNIETIGLTEVSRPQMLPVFGEDIGRNVFFIPLRQRQKELEEIPWIERATVMRLLPDRIRVSVVERQPVAFVRDGQKIGLVDADGVLLTMPAAMMAQHNYSFPVVTGINAGDPPAARKMRMAVYQRLLGELDSTGQHISSQVSEIDLSDAEDAQVLMPEQGNDVLLHFGDDRFMERYQRYKAHIAEWRQQYPKLTGVDLRYDQKVVLEMATGTDVAQTAATEQAAAASGDPNPSDAQPGDKPQSGNDSAAGHNSTEKATAGPSQASGKVKPAAKGTTKPKLTTAQKKAKAQKAAMAKAKAAEQSRKRAELKRAVFNINKQKTAPTTPPATTAGQGQ